MRCVNKRINALELADFLHNVELGFRIFIFRILVICQI